MEGSVLNKASVAATVVLYNSDEQVADNLETYLAQVDKLYVIDNSEKQNDKLIALISSKPNVEYHWMQGNEGIAAALNRSAGLAVSAGYMYMLMMDDDSRLIDGTVASMLTYIDERGNKNRIGLVAAQSDPNLRGSSAESVWYAITSGSLLSLTAYQQCGPFMNELFIDGVDHEYCYRLKQSKFDIIMLNHVFMPHRMGLPEQLRLFNRTIYRWSSHSPLRSYYIVRNFLYIIRHYNGLLPGRIKQEVYYGVIKACLLDLLLGRNKQLRLRYITKAIADYRKNRLGKF